MADILSFEDFSKVYLEVMESSYRHWTPEMQREIARHCYSWSPSLFDFKLYLQASAIRYYYTYRAILPYGGGIEICDVGGVGSIPGNLEGPGV
jgi:hypothetical protein